MHHKMQVRSQRHNFDIIKVVGNGGFWCSKLCHNQGISQSDCSFCSQRSRDYSYCSPLATRNSRSNQQVFFFMSIQQVSTAGNQLFMSNQQVFILFVYSVCLVFILFTHILQFCISLRSFHQIFKFVQFYVFCMEYCVSLCSFTYFALFSQGFAYFAQFSQGFAYFAQFSLGFCVFYVVFTGFLRIFNV